MRKNPKVTLHRIRSKRRRRHDYTTTERLFTIVEDKLYKARYASKTFKDYRNAIKKIGSDDAFWKGMEDIGKLASKLKLTLDNM